MQNECVETAYGFGFRVLGWRCKFRGLESFCFGLKSCRVLESSLSMMTEWNCAVICYSACSNYRELVHWFQQR